MNAGELNVKCGLSNMSDKNIFETDFATSPAEHAANEDAPKEVAEKSITGNADVDESRTLDKSTQCCINLPPPSQSSETPTEVFKPEEKSSSFLECLDFFVIYFKGKVVFAMFMIVTTVIRIACIVVGSVFLHDCPVQSNIPQYLIIGGVLGAVRNLIIVVLQLTKNKNIQKLRHLSSCLAGYLVIWFIIGCVWIYQVYQPNFVDPKKANYCDKTLYLFSFWHSNSTFIFVGLLFIGNTAMGCVKNSPKLKNKAAKSECVA